MRTRVALRLSVAAAVVVTAMPAAQAARRYSLAGNRLIEDKDDVFAFPQLATQHARMVSFDYGPTENVGDALLLMGDNLQAWGVALHRGDAMTTWKLATKGDFPYMNDLGSGFGLAVQDPAVPEPGAAGAGAWGDPSTGGGGAAGIAATPKTIVDAIYANGDPKATSWGLRLALGSDKTFDDPKASGVKETSDSETFFSLTGGYSDHTGDFQYDAAAALLYDFGAHVDNGKETVTGSRFDLGLTGRGSMSLEGEDDTRLGILGQFHYGQSTIEPKGAGSDAAEDLRLVGGAGPIVKVTDRITVAGYATLGLARQTHDPDSKNKGDLDGRLSVLFPGVNLATEIRLKDWMYVRTGTQYTYAFDLRDFGKSPTGTESSGRSSSFLWTAGMGFQFGDLTVDGALSQDILTEGPDFIGGDPSALFAMVSASAKF